MRLEAYKLCLSLAEAAPNLAAFASPVPLETLVALCVRGLDDESPAARYCTVVLHVPHYSVSAAITVAHCRDALVPILPRTLFPSSRLLQRRLSHVLFCVISLHPVASRVICHLLSSLMFSSRPMSPVPCPAFHNWSRS